jgi:hypothetical protein
MSGRNSDKKKTRDLQILQLSAERKFVDARDPRCQKYFPGSMQNDG